MNWKIILMICFLPLLACSTESKKESGENEESYQAPTKEDYVDRYANGIIKIEGTKIDGKRHGRWVYYYEDGMLWSEGMYRHGVRNGRAIVYYENGKKKIEGQYKNDLRVGLWKVWEDNGALVKEIDLDEMLSAEDSLQLGL